jgi:hypothetical protein
MVDLKKKDPFALDLLSGSNDSGDALNTYYDSKNYLSLLSPFTENEVPGGVGKSNSLRLSSIEALQDKYLGSKEKEVALLQALGKGQTTPTQAFGATVIGLLPMLLGRMLAKRAIGDDQFAAQASAGMMKDTASNIKNYFDAVDEEKKTQYLAQKLESDTAKGQYEKATDLMEKIGMEAVKNKFMSQRPGTLAKNDADARRLVLRGEWSQKDYDNWKNKTTTQQPTGLAADINTLEELFRNQGGGAGGIGGAGGGGSEPSLPPVGPTEESSPTAIPTATPISDPTLSPRQEAEQVVLSKFSGAPITNSQWNHAVQLHAKLNDVSE